MSEFFIKETDFQTFVSHLMADRRVIGPVRKKQQFVFDVLETPADLRLDYDVTILPPKKAFFPVKQKLVEFTDKGGRSCIAPKEQVLLGVHFYDVKGIDQLDHLFEQNHPDHNYLANRKGTTVIASNVQKVSKRAFFASVGKNVKPKGHDAFLTKIHGGYHFETFTKKGEEIVRFGKFSPADAGQGKDAAAVNAAVLEKCPEKLKWDSETIAQKMRGAFGKEEVWNDLSKTCFSCGTCNIVCPTCYCFNVEDTWNLDQVSGYRYRTWDGCQLHDFAKVSLGGGSSENFRHDIFERYRHRMMRKSTYLNTTLGGPACVGCGRCSAGCVPDIADPVKIIERFLEVSK
ncbi:MAG: 4Fe-4S dicluster domain-containing protein [Pseudomonadota bacterium]